ncbi:MAG TPA: serine/threonine-protein kinase, partial [Polyangiaceae bacterium]
MPAESTPQLEKYELLEEIGHGGMATVYRARDKRLERDVAVKIIHRHLRENQEVAARFVSEARAVAKVKHPNIVEVYDVSEQDDDERYLVVELVGGTTLRKHLQVHGHMPAEVAAALCIEVAAGLEHAHHQGIIHRDVKPENVLVELVPSVSSRRPSQGRASEPGAARVKITDFGIAKLLDVQGVTSTGQVLGSPAHMAPEQIEGGDVSERSDVFGLGVLLYECAVGKLPFEGKNPAQVLRRVLDGTYTPADRARPTVGASWSKIIDKALARDAADRYATAGEFAEALRDQFQVVGFDDPQGELAAYLADPAQYTKGYEDRIVKRLSECARLARKQRATLLAGAHFNRALAFRPNDVQLLAELTGLRRFEMLKRILVRVGAIAAGSLVLGSAAFAITRAIRARDATREALSLAGSAAEAVRGAAPQTEARPEKTALPSEPERKAGRVAGATHRSTPKPTRSVRVTVDPITA